MRHLTRSTMKLLIEDLVSVGVDGMVLEWFKSYLIDREYSVQVEGCQSRSRALNRGVFQGSVLGPILFSIYQHEA